jgi:uncharacterized protein YneF (UPF0154 family)
MAGNSGARFAKFLAFDTLGTLIWIGCYAGAGYLFAGQLETIAAYAMRTGIGVLLVLALLVGAWIGWKFIQRRRFFRKLAVARITAEDLRDRMRAGSDVLLVDLRNHRAGANEVPGALRIPAEELEARHREIPRDRDIILFCS